MNDFAKQTKPNDFAKQTKLNPDHTDISPPPPPFTVHDVYENECNKEF